MRFGLIGTGYWARTVHGPGVRDHPDTTLAGVWGRDPAKAQMAAAELGTRRYPELDDLLADVDAVTFAVPPDIQSQLAARAAARGCHLLLDKPIALDLAAADGMIAVAAQAGVRAVVFHTIRYAPDTAGWLAAQPTAGWVAARVRMFTSIYQPGSPYADSAWRQDRGALWDIGPHALSVVLPLLGAAETVVAQPGIGDQVDLVIRHASQATSSLSLSLTAPPGARGFDWQFFGQQASVTMPDRDGPPGEAFAACVSALTAPAPHASQRADLDLGRDIVAILITAEACLLARGQAVVSPA
jgi:predicted dehydrogenase